MTTTKLTSPLQFVRKQRAVFVEPTGDTFGQLYSNNYQQTSTHNHHDNQHATPNTYNHHMYYQHHGVSSWVPPDPFTYSIQHVTHHRQATTAANFEFESSQHSPVQPKEQILEEIVRECEEIERRSTSSASPSIFSSSDEPGSPESFYHPYRNPEKKERKKAQNRLAATRYREKKRKERELKMDEISELSKRNDQLKGQVGELEREIHYVKKLMGEVGVTY